LEKYRDLMRGHCVVEVSRRFLSTPQLTDIEQEINGLLSYDRRPKVPVEEIAAIHAEFFREHP
jgi:hypothetical protein